MKQINIDLAKPMEGAIVRSVSDSTDRQTKHLLDKELFVPLIASLQTSLSGAVKDTLGQEAK